MKKVFLFVSAFAFCMGVSFAQEPVKKETAKEPVKAEASCKKACQHKCHKACNHGTEAKNEKCPSTNQMVKPEAKQNHNLKQIEKKPIEKKTTPELKKAENAKPETKQAPAKK